MKLREELETPVEDAAILLRILSELGFASGSATRSTARNSPAADVIIAVDETPIGTFVEIEGSEDGIRSTAAALGRSDADYILDSYRRLFLDHCAQPATSRRPTCCSSMDRLSHALVLTAGLGTRLDPLTRVRAKPAIPVAGEPLVRRIIRWLVAQSSPTSS